MPMVIVFDKLAYTPGSVVSGHVIIVKKAPEKVKGLTMRFIGRSSKLLSETDAVKNYKKEIYFDEKMDIFGHDGTNTLLKIGETLFPFTFNLPQGLPSSFVWNSGNILYFVEAKLTRSSWKDDKRVNTRVQVDGIFDLNLDPLAYLPTEVKRHKYVQHILSKSGPYGFTFRIARSAFVRGHTIPFSVEIKNLSKLDAKKLKISLLQEIGHEGKLTSVLVEQLKGPAVPSGEIQTWECRLKVPAEIPPTNLGNVLHFPVVLSLQYTLHIELSLKSATVEPLCAKLPVTIGTVPLLRNRDRQRLQQLQMLQGSLLHHGHQLPSDPPPHPHFIHDHDCPLSQIIVPVTIANQSPSQFSPSSTLIPPGISVHSSVFVTTDADGRRNLHPHLLQPTSLNILPRYEMLHGGRGDENALFRLHHRRPGPGRRGRHHRIRESPPPPYEEAMSSSQSQETTVILSGSSKNNETDQDRSNNTKNDTNRDGEFAGECSKSLTRRSNAENSTDNETNSGPGPGPSNQEKYAVSSPSSPTTVSVEVIGDSSSEDDNDEEDEEVRQLLLSSSNTKAQNSSGDSKSSMVVCSS